MSQTRNKTLIQHLGFNDPDLKSPVHDAMVLWIADHIRDYCVAKDFDPWRHLPEKLAAIRATLEKRYTSREQRVARTLDEVNDTEPHKVYQYGVKPDVRRETEQEIEKRLQRAKADLQSATAAAMDLERLIKNDPPRPAKAPEPKVITQFEMPITTEREYIVGFVDVIACVTYPCLEVKNLDWNDDVMVTDLRQKPDPALAFFFESKTYVYYFEAKPAISSLGELLRQIRTYQTYVPPTDWNREVHFVVVSPDTRFRSAIEGQGIEFWECPKLAGD